MMDKRRSKGCFCAKEKKIKKSHSRRFLSGISATLEIQGGDPRFDPAYQPCGTGSSGMTPYEQASGMTKRSGRGFTLIELLVVVLIIGILAAVALPQYNKAVKKAQGVEALEAMDTYIKASTAYFLEHGTYEGITAETLGVDMPVLKHWKYSTNTHDDSFHFQVGSVDNYGREFLYINHEDGRNAIGLEFGKGRLSHISCYIPDYFSQCHCMQTSSAGVVSTSCSWEGGW